MDSIPPTGEAPTPQKKKKEQGKEHPRNRNKMMGVGLGSFKARQTGSEEYQVASIFPSCESEHPKRGLSSPISLQSRARLPACFKAQSTSASTSSSGSSLFLLARWRRKADLTKEYFAISTLASKVLLILLCKKGIEYPPPLLVQQKLQLLHPRELSSAFPAALLHQALP